jgi:hypothetical protein
VQSVNRLRSTEGGRRGLDFLIVWLLTVSRGGEWTIARYYAHYRYTIIAEVASQPTVHRTEM